MWNARLRLASLWLSQVARVMADACLCIVVVLEFNRGDERLLNGAWHLTVAVVIFTAILLAPFIGALINSLPKRPVLIGAAVWSLAAGLLLLLTDGNDLLWWGLLAIATAVYFPTRDALYLAAANDARMTLPQINGWMQMGAMLAVAGGIFGFVRKETLALWIVSGLSVFALVTSLPVRFASDVRRPASLPAALAGFFRDCGRVFRIAEAPGCIVGLALLRGLLMALLGIVVASAYQHHLSLIAAYNIVFETLVGLAAGCWLAGLNRHPRRVQGLAVFGAFGLALGLALLSLGVNPNSSLICLFLGVSAGLVNVPLLATYQAAAPADARGNAMALRQAVDSLGILLIAGSTFALARLDIFDFDGQLWQLTGIAVVAAIVCFWWRFRELLELLVEFMLWPMQRIRAQGPGLDELPAQGPLIVLANHSAYLDPMWVAKVVPRKLFPMMTSVFFDLPVVRWLMVNVAHAIRVPATKFRREVPEIKEAVAVLDRGDALLVFPEGMLRRKDEQTLRQFGQGIWRILRERPETPVLICWIEGGWGSFFSYFNGPPTKNKRFDIRREVGIGVNSPVVLDAAVLEHHRTTRAFLMQACLDARRHLGLEPFTLEKPIDGQAEDTPADDEPV